MQSVYTVRRVRQTPYYTHTRHVYIHVLVCVCVFSEGFYLVSESKTLRLHTNQEEEYPAIMRENTVCSSQEPFHNYTSIRVHMYVCVLCTQNHSNTIIYIQYRSDSLTVTMLGGE